MDEFKKVGQNAYIYRVTERFLYALLYSSILALVIGGFIFVADNNNYYPGLYIFIISFFLQMVWGTFVIFLESRNLGYSIQKDSIGFREGVFSVEKISIPYARITNTVYSQSLFQRLFSVGDLIIDQEDSESELNGIDSGAANKMLKEISSKSNIQPIKK